VAANKDLVELRHSFLDLVGKVFSRRRDCYEPRRASQQDWFVQLLLEDRSESWLVSSCVCLMFVFRECTWQCSYVYCFLECSGRNG